MTQLVLSLLALLMACGLTAAYMMRSRKLEPPSDRGMHTVPVPSGAGVAIVATALLLWPLSQGLSLDRAEILLLASLVFLTGVSWLDDRHRLPPAIRLGAHAAAVVLLLSTLQPDLQIVPALPLLVERTLLAIAWIWFINLFNFMDGIDGLAGSEAVAVSIGYLAIATAAHWTGPLNDLALITGAACAGYLVWNWHPARVFMGDAGSVSLGFLLGWLMIDLALHDLWAAALILPAYFAADATLTLAWRRLWRGEMPWTPHREHFYQRAVLGGSSPATIVRYVSAANAVLIVLAVLSTQLPWFALIAAAAVVAALLASLQHLAARPSVHANT